MHGAFKVDGVHTEVLVTDYGTRVLVGRHDDEMLEAAARRIAHVLKGRGIEKEVLVSLGLPAKGLGVASLRGIVRCASEFALEALGA